jgi:hypothetical protein
MSRWQAIDELLWAEPQKGAGHAIVLRCRFLIRRMVMAIVLAAGTGCGTLRSEEEVAFSREILPILSENCFSCHGPDEKSRKAGLRLDIQEEALGAGKSGKKAIVPKKSEQSEVVRRLLTRDPDEIMPPSKSGHVLTETQIGLLRKWIDRGAVWGKHWAFEVPKRPEFPSGVESGQNPIDVWIAFRLGHQHLQFAPEAPRATLIRRVSLDLNGLPPTERELRDFLHDEDPGAYEKLVNRLLASPRFGERMAWDWLDAARYADSNGYQGDSERTMWPWRDWVVSAFNSNLRFDQFTIWQLAGDLLPLATPEQRLATGFLRNHMINGEGGRIPEENRIDYLFDQTETVATVWLGATFNCTRCHDHKYDPYTQRDYFSLLACFNQTVVDGSGGNPQTRPTLSVPSPEQLRHLGEAEAKLMAVVQAIETFEDSKFSRDSGTSIEAAPAAQHLAREILDDLKVAPRDRDGARFDRLASFWKATDPSHSRLLQECRITRSERDALSSSIPKVMVMEDLPTRRPTYILGRGSYLKPGAEVGMALPASLVSRPAPSISNRLDLARWLVSRDNPLTARVIVNRYWQSLFGVGLVKTAEDFGVQGEKPVNPELLDWLASEFIDSGWDVKHLLRLMVTSKAYRQSSKVSPEMVERDPENRLLARGARFRLPSWMIRDASLAAAGLLTELSGGPSVRPYQPSGVWEEATFGNKRYEQDHGASLYRRSLFVFWRRIVGPTLFFDVAGRQTCSVRTPRTNVPLHALLTLNDPGYLEAARALAQSVLTARMVDDRTRLEAAFLRVIGRVPTPEEQGILLRGLQRHRHDFAETPASAAQFVAVGESPSSNSLNCVEHAAWTVLCSTILNLDEALTRE